MADDVDLPISAPTVVATDDVGGGRQVQLVKLVDGTGGASTPLVVDADGSGLVKPTATMGILLLASSGTVNAGSYAAGDSLGDSASSTIVPIGTYQIRRVRLSSFDGTPLPNNLVVALTAHDPDDVPAFGNSDGDPFVPADARALGLVSVEVIPGTTPFDQGSPADPSVPLPLIVVARVGATGEQSAGDVAELRTWIVTPDAILVSPFTAATLGVLLVLERVGPLPLPF